MKIVAIIPARGGSVGVPLKNIRLLGGKPLINYTIEVAIESGVFDRVIVSTDHKDIAEISKAAGAEVPFVRPPDISEDVETELVLQHAVDFLEKTNYFPDAIALLQPTSPFRKAQTIRDAYKIFASNGILFNHESHLRGDNFVTKKIVSSLTRIKNGKQKKLVLGNLYSKRDWGHAADYVEAIYKILQQKKPDDFVIATGRDCTIKEFVNKTAKIINLGIKWRGNGLNEIATDKNGKTIISIDKKYFRPLEVDTLLGDSTKAKKELNWKPKKNIQKLIKEMVASELDLLTSND